MSMCDWSQVLSSHASSDKDLSTDYEDSTAVHKEALADLMKRFEAEPHALLTQALLADALSIWNAAETVALRDSLIAKMPPGTPSNATYLSSRGAAILSASSEFVLSFEDILFARKRTVGVERANLFVKAEIRGGGGGFPLCLSDPGGQLNERLPYTSLHFSFESAGVKNKMAQYVVCLTPRARFFG